MTAAKPGVSVNPASDFTTEALRARRGGGFGVFGNEGTLELQDFKLEGLSILNMVALSNDNDFGTAGPIPFQVWVIRLAEQLPK